MPDQTQTQPPQMTLSLDMEKYLGQIEHWELTEAQKREFVEAMWGLLILCAEINLGISRVDQARNGCGQVRDSSLKAAQTAPDAVYSKDKLITKNFSGRALASEASKEAS